MTVVCECIYFKRKLEKQTQQRKHQGKTFKSAKLGPECFAKAVLVVLGSLHFRTGEEADLQELEPLVALAAQMWIRKHGFLSSSEVSSRVVRAAGVPSCIAHPRGQLQVSGPAKPRDPVQTPDRGCGGSWAWIHCQPSVQELPTQTPFSVGASRSLPSGLRRVPGSRVPPLTLPQSPWPLTVALTPPPGLGPWLQDPRVMEVFLRAVAGLTVAG